jgi:lipoprotein-anchoring transpeptidase ErfK/SrfK
VAFHGGSLERASAGCVHLDDADAIDFYNTLQLGDQVQVH